MDRIARSLAGATARVHLFCEEPRAGQPSGAEKSARLRGQPCCGDGLASDMVYPVFFRSIIDELASAASVQVRAAERGDTCYMSVLALLLPHALAFTSSLCIMILELVSSRLVARHVGADGLDERDRIHLGGICLGNVLGGRLSDRVEPRRPSGRSSHSGAFLMLLARSGSTPKSVARPPSPAQMNWEVRTILVVLIDFLIPATVLGMIGPVVAKMAVEQGRGRYGHRRRLFWGPSGRSSGPGSVGSSCRSGSARPPSRSWSPRRCRCWPRP